MEGSVSLAFAQGRFAASLRRFCRSVARKFRAFLSFLLCKILSSIDLKIRIVEILFERASQTRWCMLELGYLKPSSVLIMPRGAKEFHDLVRLGAESLVDLERSFCIVL